MRNMEIFTQQEYELLRQKYVNENLFKPKLKPFFQARFPVIKNYVYYDNPVFINTD